MSDTEFLDAWLAHARRAWERIHAESLASGDVYRARYAEWMIREVLSEEERV